MFPKQRDPIRAFAPRGKTVRDFRGVKIVTAVDEAPGGNEEGGRRHFSFAFYWSFSA
jgi:hypothetical protein